MEKKVLAGAKLAGGNPENERVENDYYATNPEAVSYTHLTLPTNREVEMSVVRVS